MSIIIRGFEMPTDASLWLLIKPDGTVHKIKAGGKYGEPQQGVAVPLPKGHGRIVDASVAEKKIKEMYMTMVNSRSEGSTEVALGLHLAASIIRTDTNVPTIVPAEGGTDNDER